MENENELKERYSSVPNPIRAMKRWVCYKLEDRDGKTTKIPVNAISGKFAKVDNKLTWTDFDTAISGCYKYGCAGLGFVLGNGIFGVDLDNHGEMNDDEFSSLSDEFINALDSYTERSQSGKGVHIICYGTLPNTVNYKGEEVKGRRRKGNVEMYDNARFFAFTGNAIRNKEIEDRTKEIIPLWKKYVDDTEERNAMMAAASARPVYYSGEAGLPLNDQEVVEIATKSKTGATFSRLMSGDLSMDGGDHSKADMRLCNMLAFWTNCDYEQVDRIFRTSGLMREKWDTLRGGVTYGEKTISEACAMYPNGGYVRPAEEEPITYGAPHVPVSEEGAPDNTTKDEIKQMKAAASSSNNFMNIDENGEPIFRMKYGTSKGYSYSDIGNAERFYDYFGECFKYNVDSKAFMFWTGKTWVLDDKSIIRKYATKLIDVLKEEISLKEHQAEQLAIDGNKDAAAQLEAIIKAAQKNKERLSNKAGRDAMLAELQAIGSMPVHNSDFDKDIYLLNTDSGIVNLKTGSISVFDREKMLSKNTNCQVDYHEPATWLEFLEGIFWRGNDGASKKETKEIIDYIQQALWYSLTGSTREQIMFLMYGNGSNGKTTFVEEIRKVMGEYGNSKESSILMDNQGKSGASVQFSLAELVGTRFLIAEETNEGEKLDEGGVKAMTGSGMISAQRKYGNPFEFSPLFKIWMLTNNLPIIRGADFGIWRRLVPIPFLRRFTDAEKDMDMPEKLAAETPQILGWCIQGYKKYQENGNRLIMPECLKSALRVYQDDMDVVSKFLKKCTKKNENSTETCKMTFDVYKNWAMSNKEYILRESKFCESMIGKGYSVGMKQNGDQCYNGLEILSSWRGSSGKGSFFYEDE